MSHSRILATGIGLIAVAMLTACGSSGGSSGSSGSGGSAGNASVQVFDVLATSQPADYLVNGIRLANNIAAGQGSYYITITAGNESFTALDAGTSTVLATAPQILGTGNYSLVLAGIPGNTTYPPILFVLQDGDQAPSAGSCLVRVINASPDAGATNFALGTSTAAWTSIAYQSQGLYQTITPGIYTQTVTSASSSQVAAGAGYSFLGGHVYSVVLYGSVSSGTQAITIHLDV